MIDALPIGAEDHLQQEQAKLVTTLGPNREPPVSWPDYDKHQLARDFRFWRHMRVLRARSMRRLHRAASILSLGLARRPSKTSYGVPMHPDWGDRTYAYCHYGTYGRYLADILMAIQCPFVFLDIGANQGIFTLLAARQPACKLAVALEPVAATFDRLEANIALNGVEDRVVALEYALSDRSGVRMSKRHRCHSGVATLETQNGTSGRSAINQPVDCRRIADIIHTLPVGMPLFVKVDVAGHEATVLDELLQSACAGQIIGLFYQYDEASCDSERIGRALSISNFQVIRRFGSAARYDALAVPIALGEPSSLKGSS